MMVGMLKIATDWSRLPSCLANSHLIEIIYFSLKFMPEIMNVFHEKAAGLTLSPMVAFHPSEICANCAMSVNNDDISIHWWECTFRVVQLSSSLQATANENQCIEWNHFNAATQNHHQKWRERKNEFPRIEFHFVPFCCHFDELNHTSTPTKWIVRTSFHSGNHFTSVLVFQM